jgi:adenylate kinase family enzyme
MIGTHLSFEREAGFLMMIALTCIAGYIAMTLGFVIWDAFIGTGVDYDNDWRYFNCPPLWLTAMFWWLSIPIITFSRFIDWSKSIKENRIERQEKEKALLILRKRQQEKLRVASEKEEEDILEQVEKELRSRNR